MYRAVCRGVAGGPQSRQRPQGAITRLTAMRNLPTRSPALALKAPVCARTKQPSWRLSLRPPARCGNLPHAPTGSHPAPERNPSRPCRLMQPRRLP